MLLSKNDSGSESDNKEIGMDLGPNRNTVCLGGGLMPMSFQRGWWELLGEVWALPGTSWGRDGPPGALWRARVGKNNVFSHFSKEKRKPGDVTRHQTTELIELSAHDQPRARISNLLQFLLCEYSQGFARQQNGIPLWSSVKKPRILYFPWQNCFPEEITVF